MSGQKKRLSDKIQSFDPMEAEEVPAVVEVSAEDAGRRARLAELGNRIEVEALALIDALDGEREAIRSLRTEEMTGSAERKEMVLNRMEHLIEAARAEDGEAEVVGPLKPVLARLQGAAEANARMLAALGGVVQQIAGLHLKAVQELGSEGLYAATGRQIGPAECSPAGMAIDL